MPEHIPTERHSAFEASLYDLLSAYSSLRQRQSVTQVTIEKRTVWSLSDARDILTLLVGEFEDWTALDHFMLRYLTDPTQRTTAIASAFAATLELVREGRLELRQDGAFEPIYLRRGPNPEGDEDWETPNLADGEDDAPRGAEGGTIADPRRLHEAARIAEALVFASAGPVSQAYIADRLPRGVDVLHVMRELKGFYAGRGVTLIQMDDNWAFRTAPDLSFVIRSDETELRKLSRAALEVLSIIAYHQPVTRAEIEDIRGVQTSKGTLDVLMEAGWVRFRGRRRSPGRPVTFGTTRDFLDHFGLEELPRPAGSRRVEGGRPVVRSHSLQLPGAAAAARG